MADEISSVLSRIGTLLNRKKKRNNARDEDENDDNDDDDITTSASTSTKLKPNSNKNTTITPQTSNNSTRKTVERKEAEPTSTSSTSSLSANTLRSSSSRSVSNSNNNSNSNSNGNSKNTSTSSSASTSTSTSTSTSPSTSISRSSASSTSTSRPASSIISAPPSISRATSSVPSSSSSTASSKPPPPLSRPSSMSVATSASKTTTKPVTSTSTSTSSPATPSLAPQSSRTSTSTFTSASTATSTSRSASGSSPSISSSTAACLIRTPSTDDTLPSMSSPPTFQRLLSPISDVDLAVPLPPSFAEIEDPVERMRRTEEANMEYERTVQEKRERVYATQRQAGEAIIRAQSYPQLDQAQGTHWCTQFQSLHQFFSPWELTKAEIQHYQRLRQVPILDRPSKPTTSRGRHQSQQSEHIIARAFSTSPTDVDANSDSDSDAESDDQDEIKQEIKMEPIEDETHQTPEEESFHIQDIAKLDITHLPHNDRKCIVSIVACLLYSPMSSLAVAAAAASHDADTDAAQIMFGMGEDGEDQVDEKDDKKKAFELHFLTKLIAYLHLDPSMIVSLRPLYCVPVDPAPFLESLRWHSVHRSTQLLLVLLHFSIIEFTGYDARVRALLRTLAHLLKVRWRWFVRQENIYSTTLRRQLEAQREATSPNKKTNWGNMLKVGLMAVGSGALLAVTGGLAAPAIGAGLAAIGVGGAGAMIAGTTGVYIVSTIFGAAGAGLVGHKMQKRIAQLDEFEFQRLDTRQESCMSVQIVINGWLNKLDDFRTVWTCLPAGRQLRADTDTDTDTDTDAETASSTTSASTSTSTSTSASTSTSPPTLARFTSEIGEDTLGLAEYSEVYALRWETQHLLNFGNGLREITTSEIVNHVAVQSLQQTALAGLVVAMTWPLILFRVADLIDNPWSMVLDRTFKAAHELANVIEAREGGRRPITLIGYSMGARVIFLALEELARRRDQRKAQRLEKQTPTSTSTSTSTSTFTSASSQTSSSVPSSNMTKTTGSTTPPLSRASSKSQSGPTPLLKIGTASRLTPAASVSGHTQPQPPRPKKPPPPNKPPPPKPSGPPPTQTKLMDADGAILDVFLLGTPIPVDIPRWQKVRSMVAGRLVNGYATNDWVLRFIYSTVEMSRAVSGVMPVVDMSDQSTNGVTSPHSSSSSSSSSTSPSLSTSTSTSTPTSTSPSSSSPILPVLVENVNLSHIVSGHGEYAIKMEQILRACHYQP